MSWSVREGPLHNYIDGRTNVHHVHLVNQVTGGEHNIELLLGCPSCPVCKRPYAQSDLYNLDPAKEINDALTTLSTNHEAIMTYAQRHGHPIKLGPLASLVPSGHKITNHGDMRMLHVPRGTK